VCQSVPAHEKQCPAAHREQHHQGRSEQRDSHGGIDAQAESHEEEAEHRLADAEALMTEYALSDTEKALVRARDWTGLVASGGHHFNIIKIAAAVGESHLHVGAHMCGANWDDFRRTLPHRVDVMPDDLDGSGR